jgi:beta-glucosidase
LGDGATDNGKDRGNSTASDEVLRALHLPGYEAVVEQGVLSVMASFNQIGGIHQHVDSLRLTGWLKTELGFDGYVIADWSGISNSTNPGSTDACGYGGCSATASKEAVRKSINAGLDMAMNETDFTSTLKTLVNEGAVSQARIDDAVRRILRAKFRAGRMDNINGPTGYTIGSAEHRATAREAVRKSLVLLKHENVLPISKSAKVYVAGGHIDNTSYQCGGWTRGWQGSYLVSGWPNSTKTPQNVPGATSIRAGINQIAAIVSSPSEADVIIYATGEEPYAEWEGDINSLVFTDTQLASLKSQNPGKKIVTIFISGRAMVTETLLSNSDAFVAAWLPGSEGAGIADVLFGEHNFTGKLPFTWPRKTSAVPKNSTVESPDWFPYGYGLSY